MKRRLHTNPGKARGRKRYISKDKALQNTLAEYLNKVANSKQPKILRNSIYRAPNSVIKSISDVALNAMHGAGIKLSHRQRAIFAKKRSVFNILINRKVALARKRKALVGKGFLAILPVLLSTVLGAIGPQLLKTKKQ